MRFASRWCALSENRPIRGMGVTKAYKRYLPSGRCVDTFNLLLSLVAQGLLATGGVIQGDLA